MSDSSVLIYFVTRSLRNDLPSFSYCSIFRQHKSIQNLPCIDLTFQAICDIKINKTQYQNPQERLFHAPHSISHLPLYKYREGLQNNAPKLATAVPDFWNLIMSPLFTFISHTFCIDNQNDYLGSCSKLYLFRELSFLMLDARVEEFSRQTGKFSYPIHEVQSNLTLHLKIVKNFIPQCWVTLLGITMKSLAIRRAI